MPALTAVSMIAVAPGSASLVSFPASIAPCRSLRFCFRRYFASPWFAVVGLGVLVRRCCRTSCGGFTGNVTGEHDSGTPVTMAATSGSPGGGAHLVLATHHVVDAREEQRRRCPPARSPSSARGDHTIASLVGVELGVEGSRRTTFPSRQPAATLLAIEVPRAGAHAVDDALEEPGDERIVDVGSTAMWISLAVTPISVAFGAPPLVRAPPGGCRALRARRRVR